MVYYLGYKKNYEYYPIKLNNITDILSLIKFTTSFSSIKDINNYLIENSLVDEIYFSYSYLTKKKGDNGAYYKPIYNGDRLYLSDATSFFDLSYLKSYLIEYLNDDNFVKSLLIFLLKKYGYTKFYIDYLNNQDDFYLFKIKYFISYLDNVEDDYVKKLLNSMREYIDKLVVNDVIRDIDEDSDEILFNMIKVLSDYIKSDSDILLNLFLYANIDIKKQPMLKVLNTLKSFLMYHSIDSGYMFNVIDANYLHDANKKTLNNRNIVDLGMFLYNYNQYIHEYGESEIVLKKVDKYDR